MQTPQRDWSVFLIGGPSGTGKTTVARQLGLQFGVSWLQADDLRLALLRSQVTLPEKTKALYRFQDHRTWQLSPEQFCQGLIALREVMSPAIEVVVENHVDTAAPIVIEGDAILPSLLARPSIRQRMQNGQVRFVFLIEPDEHVLLANMLARGRGIEQFSEAETRMEARANWLYGQWLSQEAHHYGLPVVLARPWETLIERIIQTVKL